MSYQTAQTMFQCANTCTFIRRWPILMSGANIGVALHLTVKKSQAKKKWWNPPPYFILLFKTSLHLNASTKFSLLGINIFILWNAQISSMIFTCFNVFQLRYIQAWLYVKYCIVLYCILNNVFFYGRYLSIS